MSRLCLLPDRLFDGESTVDDAAVVIADGRVEGVTTRTEAPPDALPVSGLLAPGFVDCQVNGGGGVLFNDMPTVDTLASIIAAHQKLGTTSVVATFISDDADRMHQAVDAVRTAIAYGLTGLAGLHLEGPWLAPSRRGVHNETSLRPLTNADIKAVASLAPLPVIVTVAPEIVAPHDVARLTAAGARVLLGHTAASAEVASAALDAGAIGFTHLFNAMPPLAGREPGVLGCALLEDRAYCSIILDGHHVHPVSAAVALRAKPPGKLFLVSDAMATVGTDLRQMDLYGRPVRRLGDRLETPEGTLAGAHLSMATAVRNAVGLLGVSLGEALRMASRYPAELLGRAQDLGRVTPGAIADLVLLDDEFAVQRVWAAGVERT